MLNKSLLREWASHPVTENLREVIKERIEEGLEELLNSRDPDYCNAIRGLVKAYREILEWEPEIQENEKDD